MGDGYGLHDPFEYAGSSMTLETTHDEVHLIRSLEMSIQKHPIQPVIEANN